MSATKGISTTTSNVRHSLTPSFLMWVWRALDVAGVMEARKGMTEIMPLPTALWVVMLNGARKNN